MALSKLQLGDPSPIPIVHFNPNDATAVIYVKDPKHQEILRSLGNTFSYDEDGKITKIPLPFWITVGRCCQGEYRDVFRSKILVGDITWLGSYHRCINYSVNINEKQIIRVGFYIYDGCLLIAPRVGEFVDKVDPTKYPELHTSVERAVADLPQNPALATNREVMSYVIDTVRQYLPFSASIIQGFEDAFIITSPDSRALSLEEQVNNLKSFVACCEEVCPGLLKGAHNNPDKFLCSILESLDYLEGNAGVICEALQTPVVPGKSLPFPQLSEYQNPARMEYPAAFLFQPAEDNKTDLVRQLRKTAGIFEIIFDRKRTSGSHAIFKCDWFNQCTFLARDKDQWTATCKLILETPELSSLLTPGALEVFSS